MHLHRIQSEAYIDENSTILGVQGCKVWYVHDGRNAWHSTWVQRFADGCMHLQLDSAKGYCESKRVKGSVFYIHELPALRIESELGIHVVTEINCRDPLSKYLLLPQESSLGVHSAAEDEKRLSTWRIGSLLQPAIQSFGDRANHWPAAKSTEDNLFAGWLSRVGWVQVRISRDGVISTVSLGKPHELSGTTLYSYTSKPMGTGYLLGWDRKGSGIRQGGVLNILRSIGVPVPASKRSSRP